jgi:hypothetical protein
MCKETSYYKPLSIKEILIIMSLYEGFIHKGIAYKKRLFIKDIPTKSLYKGWKSGLEAYLRALIVKETCLN